MNYNKIIIHEFTFVITFKKVYVCVYPKCKNGSIKHMDKH